MARRLVLKVEAGEMKFSEFTSFYKEAVKFGVDGSASIDVDAELISKDTNELVTGEVAEVLFGVRLPDDRLHSGDKVKPRKVSKKQKAVKKQIKTHRKKRAEGKPEAYVPPAGRTTPPKPPKVKCPVCNVRKAIVRAGKVATIKPHVVHGEPCDGGGTQVVKSGRSWKIPNAK